MDFPGSNPLPRCFLPTSGCFFPCQAQIIPPSPPQAGQDSLSVKGFEVEQSKAEAGGEGGESGLESQREKETIPGVQGAGRAQLGGEQGFISTGGRFTRAGLMPKREPQVWGGLKATQGKHHLIILGFWGIQQDMGEEG